MDNYTYTIKALSNLMPLGGWSYDGVDVFLHEDGIAHGYTLPSNATIQAEAEKIGHNQPLLEELEMLDKKVVRALEGLIPETDTYNYNIVLRKRELRSQLV